MLLCLVTVHVSIFNTPRHAFFCFIVSIELSVNENALRGLKYK